MSQWKSGQPLKQGKYIIDQLLGCGGFGVTYRAKDSASGKLVAIKTLNISQQFKPNFNQIQEKFLNEALCLARCQHPHIVEVYPQLFQEDGVWCMVMDYIDGQDLASYRQSRGRLLEAEALEIIKQVGEALIYVHQQGFLHRDVKPKNILLRQDSLSVVLIDFGLAREFIPGEEQSLTNWGTECFAPIEQYERRGNFGAYTDVYALAATLYFVLTGELPYSATIRQQGNIPLVPPKHHNPQISDRVNNAILKGMELEPQSRPQTVQEWLMLLSSPQLSVFHFEVITVDATGEIINRCYHDTHYFVEALDNEISLEMIAIPGGEFLMGSPETEEGRRDTENPQHLVKLSSFYMGKYPITQAQWQLSTTLPEVNQALNPNPSSLKGKNRPVEQISWNDAVEFCARLSQKTGRMYRLSSEAEWEYACRAGTTTPFYFGETITPELANFNGSFTYAAAPKSIYHRQSTDVGSFPPNAFGLYDMHGNVWEWCADLWHSNYRGAPSDGRVWNGAENNQFGFMSRFRVLRGGSWVSRPKQCRCASRLNGNLDDWSLFNFGLRVVCY
ncbi:SUMF1/EgtB/PvdO family nonheme iron enzyme [Coleofasciculus sp. E2-BRE-01]|uniref:SUMF1/EgtB/PvdO family nonheme iron enzyme n=1 Tax=Coleofasciculus sp. E2-BRE-01 TaxID=3069524 RepID=UPI0032F8FE8E